MEEILLELLLDFSAGLLSFFELLPGRGLCILQPQRLLAQNVKLLRISINAWVV